MALRQDEQVKHGEAAVTLHGRELVPNRQMKLNLDWVEEIQVNTSAVERRAASLGGRRSRGCCAPSPAWT
jgi:deoxyribose-phosphate aldolase